MGENKRKINVEAKYILPTFDEIFNQIEVFRRNSIKYLNTRNDKYDIRNNKYNYKLALSNIYKYNSIQYYNNISILGNRGTGKTSLLVDIRENLIQENDNFNDIIFDIITPDIRDKEDILGWIISLVISKANKIKELKNYKSECNFYNNYSKIDKGLTDLKQAYFFRKSRHESVIINDYSSKIDYLKDNEDKLNADVELKLLFTRFIDSIVDELRGDGKEPLLIFFFDDVDIHSNRINEVLTTIMSYLSHPNIINIIAADYDSALENVTLKMLEEDQILDSELINLNIETNDYISVLERRENRSYDFLKKVLPPAYRHYIPELSSESKFNIFKACLYQYNTSNELNRILSKIKDYIYYYPGSRSSETILTDYTCFLDNTIRGCSNVIKFIQSRDIDSIFLSDDKRTKFKFLEELLNVIIESNKKLGKNKEFIKNVINLSQDDKLNIDINSNRINFNGYINYYAIVDRINKLKDSNEVILSEDEFELYYELFILANMFEILIISFNLRDDEQDNYNKLEINKLHGLEELTSILNYTKENKPMALVPRIKSSNINNKDDIQELICIKQNIFKVLRYNEIQQLFKEENSGYLESVYIDSFNHKGEIVYYLANIFMQDRGWATSIIDWIIYNAPTDNTIKSELINELESSYKYKIDEPNKNLYDRIHVDCYFKKEADVWAISNDFLAILYECIDNTQLFFTLSDKLESINFNISNYEELINNMKENLKLNNEDENIDSKYVEINNEIRKYENFLEDDVNKEIWNRFKDKVITTSNDKQMKLLDFIGVKLKIDIRDKLKKFYSELEDKYFNELEVEEIVIKTELAQENEDLLDFIKSYYEGISIIEALKNHPIIMYKKSIDNVNYFNHRIETLKTESNKINHRKLEIIKLLKSNEIIKYLLKNELGKERNIKKIRISLFEDTVSYSKIEESIIEFIKAIIDFYESEPYKSKVISFRYLLNTFFKEIEKLKSIDKRISSYLYSDKLDISSSYINYYEKIFNNINSSLDNIDLAQLKDSLKMTIESSSNNSKTSFNFSKIKKSESNHRNELEKLLNIKENQLKDEVYNLKIKVFRYAFNLTLHKYLQHKIKESHQELSLKVRTRYLIEKREKLKGMKMQSPEFISFNEYIKSKLI